MLFVENFNNTGKYIEENRNHPHYHYLEITTVNIVMYPLPVFYCAFYMNGLFVDMHFIHALKHAQLGVCIDEVLCVVLLYCEHFSKEHLVCMINKIQ